eukprot:scaffold105948_cov106-Cyclotella_meneghiniana.AAC.1
MATSQERTFARGTWCIDPQPASALLAAGSVRLGWWFVCGRVGWVRLDGGWRLWREITKITKFVICANL